MKKNLIYHNVFIIFFVLFSSESVLAQLGFCNGNSGDPIFTETFGIGTTNTPLSGGTTTYNYTSGFPNDGFYTVRNGSFGNSFDWHQTQDHTVGDVNGKCLIVNAEFSAGEFYRNTVSGLCENTTYEFSAWLMNLVIAGSFCSSQPSGTIPINVRFEIWDNTDTNLLASGNTGNITETSTPNWQEYALVFQTLPAQTSVILKMINNGIGGCGNDLAIDDIVFKSCGDFIEVSDPSGNNNISLCSGQTPYSTIFTATPDNTVFSNHFFQWQESADGIIWTDIIGETNQTLTDTGITTTTYYRAKVAEYATNLSNADCITFSDEFSVIVTQAGSPPTTQCWETATLNNTTCLWEVTGTQPTAPTGLACYETTVFNTTSCIWDISGTQPTQPTIACYETASFNTTTCIWDVTGTQSAAPTGLACYENATFNTTTCLWEVSGIQPTQPSLECWETATFNNITCIWDVTGTQSAAPIGLACYETTTFNATTCLWEVTGTQPAAPTGLACYENATFNITTCLWEVSGIQPTQPSLECWETATFNNTTCIWDVTGTQPAAPIGLACYETAIFNTTTCFWDVSGTQPIDSIEKHLVFCEGEDIALYANTTLVNPNYLWETGEITDSISVSNPGNYSVEVSDGCTTTIINFYVLEIELPIIKTVTSNSSNIVIETTSAGDFLYSLDGIQYQSNNTFYNIENGLYVVYVKDHYGCDSATIEYLHFIIPNYFTPNNDGVNDTFNLNGIENYNTSEVYIFDRYGKLLKSAKNQTFTWDGTFNNLQLPSADYWYIIILDNQEIKGHFTLKR